jgi:MFS family permease
MDTNSQQQRGASAIASAAWFLPMPVTYLVYIPVVNALAHRTGPRLPMAAGLAMMASGMTVYAAAGPQAERWWLALSFVLAGAGLSLTRPGRRAGDVGGSAAARGAGVRRREPGAIGGYHCRCGGVG